MAAPTKPTLGRGDMASRWKWAEASYVRDLRIARGLTQHELGELIGFTNNKMISAIENAHSHVPPERTADFADALHVPLDKFGKVLLRYQNAWLYAAIFGADSRLKAELARAPDRSKRVKKGPPDHTESVTKETHPSPSGDLEPKGSK